MKQPPRLLKFIVGSVFVSLGIIYLGEPILNLLILFFQNVIVPIFWWLLVMSGAAILYMMFRKTGDER